MLGRALEMMEPVLGADQPEAASLAFFEGAKQYGASYLQTRLYRRPAAPLTPFTHLKAGGVVARVAPKAWNGSQAFNYVCLDCNPLVEAIRQGLTSYRFSDFAPRTDRMYGAYWEAMSEARIGDALCATAYRKGRRIASLHLGFDDEDIETGHARELQLAGLMLVETLMSFDDNSADALETEATLTARERDSLRFVAEGKTDWEIGTIFGISETTARFHVDNARRKLGAVNRAHAVARFLTTNDIL